jgi:hypothetical protein
VTRSSTRSRIRRPPPTGSAPDCSP